ncbi:universal stress protein [Nocardia blacklockiae]|uniref:universal stress protein n=1 Tax=Nocardia blacklockiae TaxID=480036 RepID=UPI001894E075|nr:universal stress protein [Nocardia blacklockiae]MBF6176614.1 universal stress protein [Nocardia blacklockiae]
MTVILVCSSNAAQAVARALADVTGATPHTVDPDLPVEEYLLALSDPEVDFGVLALDRAGWEIAQDAGKPIVLVPNSLRPADVPATIEHVLVPLDGTDEAAHAVAETVRLFRAAGTEIAVLHVFDRSTVPASWDQAAHARSAWEEEFLARYCAPHLPGAPPALTLRSGSPGETVVDVAAEQADMIILGWSQRLLPGRAQTVRKTVDAAPVPVMLIPVVSVPAVGRHRAGSARLNGLNH